MQNVVQEFTIGFFDSSGVFSIYAKQDDVGRMVKFHLADGVQDYEELLSDPELLILVRVQLPSGTVLPGVSVGSDAIDIDEMSITIPLTKEMLQQYGTAVCELMFGSTQDDRVLSSTHFKLIIQRSYSYVTPSTEELFDTWTELYIAVCTLQKDITEAEAFRVDNENTRISNENIRIVNEDVRKSNENERKSNEDVRKSNENERKSNEDVRKSNEDVRKSAEKSREEAEKLRAQNMIFTGYTAEWNDLSLEEKERFKTVILLDD